MPSINDFEADETFVEKKGLTGWRDKLHEWTKGFFWSPGPVYEYQPVVEPELPEHLKLPRNTFVGPRVLTLDGGGSRGLVMAIMIENLEEKLNHPEFHGGQSPQDQVRIWQLFDLVAGTSTGGILAASLGLKRLSGQQCRGLYQDLIPKLFEQSRWRKIVSTFTRNKYSDKVLREQLNKHFQEFSQLRTIQKLPVVAVTSFDIQNNDTVIFCNTDRELNNIKVTDALRATSAAPTYFPAVPLETNHRKRIFVDGGLGANCPAAVAIKTLNMIWNADMFRTIRPDPYEQWPQPRTCDLLVSLGTGKIEGTKSASAWGIFNTVKWALKLVELATLSEMRFKSAKTDLKMHNPFGYHERLNPDVDTGIGELSLDSTDVTNMSDNTDEWLTRPHTEEMFWRTCYKVVARNFYVDVDPAVPYPPNTDGWVELEIKQRTELFKLEPEQLRAEMFVPGRTGRSFAAEIVQRDGGLVLRLQPQQHVEKARVGLVKLVPRSERRDGFSGDHARTKHPHWPQDDVERPEESYFIAGAPFKILIDSERTVTLD